MNWKRVDVSLCSVRGVLNTSSIAFIQLWNVVCVRTWLFIGDMSISLVWMSMKRLGEVVICKCSSVAWDECTNFPVVCVQIGVGIAQRPKRFLCLHAAWRVLLHVGWHHTLPTCLLICLPSDALIVRCTRAASRVLRFCRYGSECKISIYASLSFRRCDSKHITRCIL